MAAEALAELEALLVAERDAICRMDGQAVLEFAQRKQAMIATLNANREALGADDAARLQALTPALRQNGVLLAHARDVIRDAIAAMRSERSVAPSYGIGRAPAVRSTLSIRG